MQIPDFRQYTQSEALERDGRNILVWTPRRSAFAAQNADAELTKIMQMLVKDETCTAEGKVSGKSCTS